MAAGNTSIPASKALCEDTYTLVRNNPTKTVGMSNMLTFPTAKKYVERLLQECPAALPSKRRLAVVTGVTQCKACPAYYVAEELVVSADMDVILAGPDSKELRESVTAIHEELARRKTRAGIALSAATSPSIVPARLDTHSLRAVSKAARGIVRYAQQFHQGQLHVLVNLGGQVSERYSMTNDGVDANMGHNYLAPRLLTDLLLPVLRAASTDTYTPRIIQEGSVGHCVGGDFDPNRLRKLPREGGAPHGTVVWDEDTNTWEYADDSGNTNAGLNMFYRSKMALMADMLALGKEEPMLAAVCVDPGILSYTDNDNGATATAISSRSSWSLSKSKVLGLSHSQAARSALRAALDPEFDITSASESHHSSMHYLHCDGNPWTMADPTLSNYSGMEEYAETIRHVGEEVCGQLVADTACGWELYSPSSRPSSTGSMSSSSSLASSSMHGMIDLSDSSSMSFGSEGDKSNHGGAVQLHGHWQCHSFHSSLLEASAQEMLAEEGRRSCSSLVVQ